MEYSAASDAYTHAPEGFNEFYNQRRRWVPSTIANIMDLLMDSKKTIKVNDNISMPYIAYQILLMGGTILGPGTIFLMLVGAFVAAFQIDNWTSFYYNIIPILTFMLVCFTCKSNIQVLISFRFLLSQNNTVFFAASRCSDSVNRLRFNYDGSDSRYGSPVTRGRNRISICDFLDRHDRLVFHSGLSASTRVLVYRPRYHLPTLYSVYVLAIDFVFYYQFERCILGYQRSGCEED